MQTAVWTIRRAVESVMALFLMAMVALTFADVIGRRLFGSPVYGAHDLTEHLMAIVVFCGLPLVTAAGAHLTIDLFDRLLGRPGFRWWRAVCTLLVVAVLGLLAWVFLRHGFNAARIAEVSQALRLPRGPLYFFIATSFALSAIAAAAVALSGPMVDPEETHEEEAL